MRPDLFSLDDLRLVRAVADMGGLAPAALRLGIDASTVFRRLGALEARLELRLFERHRSGYRATPPGDEMAAAAARMEDEVAALSLRLAGRASDAEGEVRVTTNDTLLLHLLTPLFAAFRRAHPSTRIEVLISNEALNLSRRDADVAIRVTNEPPDTLVGRRVARLGWALYAPAPIAGAELDPAGQDWIALGGALENVAAARATRRRAAPGRIAYKVNSVIALTEAVEAGMGIGFLPCYLAAARPGLVRLEPPDPDLAGSLWLLTHPELRHVPRVRHLLDHLAGAIGQQRARLGGEG